MSTTLTPEVLSAMYETMSAPETARWIAHWITAIPIERTRMEMEVLKSWSGEMAPVQEPPGPGEAGFDYDTFQEHVREKYGRYRAPSGQIPAYDRVRAYVNTVSNPDPGYGTMEDELDCDYKGNPLLLSDLRVLLDQIDPRNEQARARLHRRENQPFTLVDYDPEESIERIRKALASMRDDRGQGTYVNIPLDPDSGGTYEPISPSAMRWYTEFSFNHVSPRVFALMTGRPFFAGRYSSKYTWRAGL